MYKWLLLLVFFVVGCKQRPYSQHYIYTEENDHLSIQEKVDILRSSSTIEDDALLAAIASLYAQNNNWAEAKSSITKAIKLNPLEPSYHLYLANYQVELNNPVQAYEEAKVAQDLKAYDPRLEALLARMAIETGDSTEGAGFVRRYYQSNLKDAEAQLLMARLSLYEGKIKEAYRLVKKGLIYDTLNEQGWFTAFEVYKQMDSTQKAVECGRKLLGLDTLNVKYYSQLADLLLETDNKGRAMPFLSNAFLLSGDFNMLKTLINYQIETSRFDSVLFYTDSLYAGTYHNEKYVMLERARAYDKRYKYDEAYALYDQLLERDTTDSVVIAEQSIVQRKIAYLQRKKEEQRRLADSLANAMPLINF